ncbi:MAG: T9SS type B sorting domain-containing protein [Flavobacteriaceae bacterium]|nr:MAG: T9SS type B sorting domain-containing protein [Flavobacteriaceae bacterium]
MKKIVSLIILITSIGLFAQQEASNWYFGENAGIRFDAATGNVTALTDGQLNTREGCSSISDSDGNLLFYSDGRIVYNRNHDVMINGTGLFGDSSSTQSAIIVAKPDDPDIYYIFTVDTQLQNQPPSEGLNYSEVDMALDGGLGAVTVKNFNLLPKSSEKITAVLKDCISKAVWVLTLGHQSGTLDTNFDSYFAYEVTNTGVNPIPIVSTFPMSIQDRRGYLKFSPDGLKMACANMNGEGAPGSLVSEKSLLLYDFDVNTGIVSNQLELIINSAGNQAYGVEFSPSNELLYVHSSNGQGGNNPLDHFSSLVQFDLYAADIQASEFLLDERQLYRGGLQLGPNGKIYRALSATYTQGLPFLGVINNPDVYGAGSNYQHNAVPLAGNNSTQGLPPFDQALFNTKIDIIRNGISISNLDLCDGDNYTLLADDIPGATYSWTLDGNPLVESDFDLVVTQAGLYEVLIDQNNGDCLIEGEAFVNYFTNPIANQPNDINICDDDNDGVWSFDLTTLDAEVLNGQDPMTYEIKYYTNQVDADDNMNEIVGDFQNTSNPQEIFVRSHNILNNNCYDTTSFFLEIFDTPVANPITDIEECDDDLDGDNTNGQKELDLLSLVPEALGAQVPMSFSVSFHLDQADANSGVNPLVSPYYNIMPFNQTIFYRIQNNANNSCFDTGSFLYTVNPIPPSYPESLIQCDEDGLVDGLTLFNLTEADDALTGGATDVSTSFFLSLADAQSNTGSIDGNSFSNTMNPQIIHVRVTNNNTGCFSITDLTLDVSLTNIMDADLAICDDDGTEDGLSEFMLSDADANVLSAAPPGVTLFYYETYDDALLEQNPIGPTYANIAPYSQIIYARAENANACYGISEVELTVHELPDIEIIDEAIYCLNSFPDTITLTGGVINDSPSNYTYLWSTGEMTPDIEIDAPGIYSVIVTNSNNCSKERTITVLPSNIATISDIEVSDASSNNTVTVLVTGEGDYEFALDDALGPYQDSNFFENVAPGIHTVYVRDKNNCGIVEEMVSVIGFPKFFTPNNDGYHDRWQVYGLTSQFQPNTKIYIYDRYGKLLKELDPIGRGWDGKFNGKPLPTNDYWFAVSLEDGRIFKSHFTLKR